MLSRSIFLASNRSVKKWIVELAELATNAASVRYRRVSTITGIVFVSWWADDAGFQQPDPLCRTMASMLAPRMLGTAGLLVLSFLVFKRSEANQPSSAPSHRRIRVFGHCSVDIDRTDASQPECMVMVDGDGTESLGYPNSKGSDFRVEERQNRIYFRSLHGATLAIADDAGHSTCENAQYSKHLMRVDDMAPGSLICIRTAERRYGQMKIEKVIGPPTNTVELSYVVW